MFVGLVSAGSDEFGGPFLGRVAATGVAEDGRDAVFAECVGQGVAEFSVVVFQSADPFGCGLEAAQQ